MSDDTNDQGANAPAGKNEQEQQQPRHFTEEPWQVLIGLRTEGQRVITGMCADPAVMVDGPGGRPRPDKTNPAVYFSLWLERHLPGLQKMCEAEYSQYMNLRMLTSKAKTPPVLPLVDTEGQRLGSNGTTQ